MSGTRGGRGRIVAMGIGLVLALLLVGASEARAGKYTVAQCGWHLNSEAIWADTTGGTKFRQDSYCATPASADPFAGTFLASYTREGQQTVSGNRYASRRWTTPAGTGITAVRGTWWHILHDGMEQRLGTDGGDGGFAPFARASATDTAFRDFAVGFWPPQWAFEDRLLCARAETKWCNIDQQSWSALRALTITVEDDGVPTGSVGGGIVAGGWLRGAQSLQAVGSDIGSGVRFGETNIDGARVALTEYPCSKAMIGGEWRGTRMRPCETAVSAAQTISTTAISDGPHHLSHCLIDFAGNYGCPLQHTIGVDNNAPGHARSLAVAEGDGWRRVNNFDLVWANPEQGVASPIWGAYWQITNGTGYDSGVGFASGRDVAGVPDIALPAPGLYSFHLWLRDEAGNQSAAASIEVPLRFDNVLPGVAFANESGSAFPDTISADIYDEHAGPASGEMRYRRLGADNWTDLTARFVGGASGQAKLVARLPESLDPGTYLFQAEAADGAGNVRTTSRRADGTEMSLRKPPPPAPDRKSSEKGADTAGGDRGGRPDKDAAARVKTRIFARLHWQRRRGTSVTVPFGGRAILVGRLLDAGGAGLSGRRLRVVSRPSRGSLARTSVAWVRTGEHGGFRLELPAGPSRKLTVAFMGEDRLDRARRAALSLRVRGGVVLHAAPGSLKTGQDLRLWGRIRTQGAPIPRRGKLVAIQYLEEASGRWRPVLVIRSDHSGHFRARYRFRYISSSARIQMRAVALSEERWPYVPGASRPVGIRVSG